MDEYTLISLVGVGSFGRVYKGINKETQATVALKIIGKRDRSNKEIISLRGECEIQAQLNHPCIIRMLHSFETINEIVVVTEYAQSDLHKLLIRERSITEERAQRLSYNLVSALYYLHSHRILHRDLKPQNILLDRNENAKLCDFGLARNMTIGTHVLTSIKGTPLYMAPELMSEKPYDHLADLWSLGCIIYETLAGEPPFCTTSFIRLVKLIRHEHVKWPSFLTDNCISFLKGLLEKDPSLRMEWTQILKHPFVKGHIEILNENVENSPFTHPLSVSQNVEKEKQKNNLMRLDLGVGNENNKSAFDAKDAVSSRDSVQAILQSDMENIETDVDDAASMYVVKDSAAELGHYPEPCYVSGNHNLIVNNYNDNFQAQAKDQKPSETNASSNREAKPHRSRNRELEKRKLSQNLDNFSVRLSKNGVNSVVLKDNVNTNSSNDLHAESGNSAAEISDKNFSLKDITPPSMLPGWDSCDEYHNPPIENEEWLAFLYRSMQEVLDGEIGSLKQQNLVSIIVAPLRNYKASIKVILNVAQLLSLPLAIGFPDKDMLDIQSVYIEVKLVPNLVYASKLLCRSRCSDIVGSPSPTMDPVPSNMTFKNSKLLTSDDMKTLLSLYELVCHLVHLDDQFLTQFCDAVAILGTSDLLVNLLTIVTGNSASVRLANAVLALLCYSLRELPENAELVEKIIFNKNLDLVSLMQHKNSLLKSRVCMLLRMIGRFSCCALQNVWSKEFNNALASLLADKSDNVRQEAEKTMEEYKHLPFFYQHSI